MTEEEKIQAEKLAKDILNNMSDKERKDLETMLIEGIGINRLKDVDKNAESIKLKNLEKELKTLEDTRQSYWDKSRNTDDYDIKRDNQEKAFDLGKEINEVKAKMPHLINIVECLDNGGELLDLTDKKGNKYSKVADFRGISTDVFSWSEEDILEMEKPKYIPTFNEKKLENKGFIFDTIRYTKDSYIVAIPEFRDKIEENQSYGNWVQEDVHLIILTLDQLVLISDYYYVKARAKAIKEAEASNKRAEDNWYSKDDSIKERYYNQTNFYYSIPAKIRKTVTKEKWDSLPLPQKERLYIPIQRKRAKKVGTKLQENKIYGSFDKMYQAFVDPTATAINWINDQIKVVEKQGVSGGLSGNKSVYDALLKEREKIRRGKYAHPDVFDYWSDFKDKMNYKLLDIKVQRTALSEVYQKGMDTSYGHTGENDVLYNDYGIMIKRQNGSKINFAEQSQIEESWIEVQKTFGNLKPLAMKYNLVISHAGKKYQFANKRAIGIYIPSMGAVGVSNKYGEVQFTSTMAHEIAHFIDYSIGQIRGLRYSTDDYEGTAGLIAFTFRNNMNKSKDNQTDYINSTKECFARALQQYFSFKKYGYEGTIEYSEGVVDDNRLFLEDTFVGKANWEKVLVLIEKFFEENNDVLETTFDLDGSDEKVPIGTEIPDNIETDEQLMSYISSVSDIDPNILKAKFYKKYFLPTTKKEVDEFLSNVGEIKYVTIKEGRGIENWNATFIAGKSYPVIREVKPTKTVPEGQFEIIDTKTTNPVILAKSRFVGFDDVKENPITKKIRAFELLLDLSTGEKKKLIEKKIKAFKLIENL